MKGTRAFLEKLNLPAGDAHALPSSRKRFPDGAQYRVEIPTVEGPKAFRALVEEMRRYNLTIHRISQGSGIMLLTDEEILEMVEIGCDEAIEVSLFIGPRASFDINVSPHTSAGKNIGLRVVGMDQVVFALEDVKRACSLGIRSILVADEGLLWVINEMKKAEELPANLVVKVSVSMGMANPVSIRLAESIGANTYNVPSDMTVSRLAAIRQAVDIPLDIYIEVPDEFGGFARYYEMMEMIRVAAPVYLKFGLRNAPNIYPSGTHLEDLAVSLTRERIRRAKIGCDLLQRYNPELVSSNKASSDLGVPFKVKDRENPERLIVLENS